MIDCVCFLNICESRCAVCAGRNSGRLSEQHPSDKLQKSDFGFQTYVPLENLRENGKKADARCGKNYHGKQDLELK